MTEPSTSAWAVLAEYEGGAALVDAVLDLDPGETYTRNELSEAAGVPYKTLYLDGTLAAIADLGLLEKREADGEEARFAVRADGEAYAAASAFADVAAARSAPESTT